MPKILKQNDRLTNKTAPSNILNMQHTFLPKIRKLRAVHSKNPYKLNIKPPLPPELKYKPKKLNGLLFYSLENNGNKCHPLSLHSGMPVKTGNKYIANIWLREQKYTIL